MQIKITIRNVDKDLAIVRNYEFDDSNYVSHPWEVTIPDMIEQVSQDNETL